MPVSTGNHLGPYRISTLLGAGGMGEVYKAADERLGRDVAIKILRQEVNSDPDLQRLFAREARSASALNHTNILTVYDVGMEGEVPYIVTEFVAGEPLIEADLARPAAGPQGPRYRDPGSGRAGGGAPGGHYPS